MKTLLVAPSIFRGEGGIARLMRLYLRALRELAQPGDQLGYIALVDRPEDARRAALQDGAVEPVERGPAGPGAAGGARPRLVVIGRTGTSHSKASFVWQLLRQGWNADRVVCGHIHLLPVVWALSLVRPRLKYFLVAHGIEVWRTLGRWEARALGGCACVMCVSAYTRDEVIQRNRLLALQRVVVVPNALDPSLAGELFPPLPAVEKIGAPRILVVSRLAAADRRKGVQSMIEAMPGILAGSARAHLRIVGDGDDLDRLRDLARGLGLAEAVSFTGRVDDSALRAEYAACDLFALPSAKEGFGLVYLEAMAWGKPCIAARAGGAPEVVDDTVGRLVEYGDLAGIAKAVADLVTRPPAPQAISGRVQRFTFGDLKRNLASHLGGGQISTQS